MPLIIDLKKLKLNYTLLYTQKERENYNRKKDIKVSKLKRQNIKEINTERKLNGSNFKTTNKSTASAEVKSSTVTSSKRRDVVYPDYTELESIAKYINENSVEIDNVLLDRYSFKNPDETFFNPQDVLKPLYKLAQLPRNIHFIFLKSVVYNSNDDSNKNDTKICEDDIFKKKFKLAGNILRPPSYHFGSLSINEVTHEIVGKFRYIPNFDVNECLAKIQLNGMDLHGDIRQKERFMIFRFIFDIMNQSRSISISHVALALYYTSTLKYPCNLGIHRCDYCYNPYFEIFQSIFNTYVRWPFLDYELGMMWDDSVSVSTSHVYLMYALNHRYVSYQSGVISTGIFHLAMITFQEWAITSFHDMHLQSKGDMNKVVKLLHETISSGSYPVFRDNQPIRVVEINSSIEEYWDIDEKETLLSIVRNSSNNRDYYDLIDSLSKKKMSLNEFISIKMSLECVTNPSDYKKSTPIMEFDRSVKPVINKIITLNEDREFLNGIMISNSYKGVMHDMYDKIVTEMSKHHDEIDKYDFIEEYYARLSNNSAGLTRESLEQIRFSHPIVSAIPDLPLYSRYINALVDDDVLYDNDKLIQSLSKSAKSGKREQVDRRSRFIMMVSNGLQVIFSITLTLCKLYAKSSKYIASGKQTGNISDMYEHLSATSDPSTIVLDSDIVGADTSTQTQVMEIPLQAALVSILEHEMKQFFFASRMTVSLSTIKSGVRALVQKDIPAIAVFFTTVLAAMNNTSYDFTDGFILSMMKIPSSIFWSGAFHTAMNHNVNFDSMIDLLVEIYVKTKFQLGLNVRGSILGDDVSLKLKYGTESRDLQDECTREFFERMKMNFADVGYNLEPESSRIKCTFLQQVSILGCVSGRSARLSLFCSENVKSRSRNPFAQLHELGDIFGEYSSRCPIPESIDGIISALWIVNGEIKIFNDNMPITNLADIHVLNYIDQFKDHIIITIPYVSKYLPNANGTKLPQFNYNDTRITPSFYTPKGTITYWILSKMFKLKLNDDEYAAAYKAHVDRIWNFVNKGKTENTIGFIPKSQIAERHQAIPLKYLINYEIMSLVGLTFGQWLIENQDKIPRMTKEELMNPSLQNLFKKGRQKMSKTKMLAAQIGYRALVNEGLKIPYEITYMNQAKVRITQAIESHKYESSPKYTNNLIKKINTTFKVKKYQLFKFEDINIIDFDVDFIAQNDMIPFNLFNNAKATISPCIPLESKGYFLQSMMGLPGNETTRDLAAEMLNPDLPIGSSIDALLKYGTKILIYKNGIFANQFLDAVGVQRRDHEKVLNLLRHTVKYDNVTWQSIIPTRKFFFFSTNTIKVSNLISASSMKHKFVNAGLPFIITRDLLFMTCLPYRFDLYPRTLVRVAEVDV